MAALQRMLILACFAVLTYSAASASCYNKLSASTFTDCELIDDTYALHWTINGTTIYLGVEVDGQPGWVGFGLSEAGGMAGADMVTVLKNDQGGWTVVDRWSKAFEEPMADSQQDYRLAGDVLQDSTSTAFVLHRNITTCDRNDLDVNLGIKQHVVWALGDSWGYHGSTNRGMNIVTFGVPPLSLQAADLADETSIASLNISMPNVSIPVRKTTYLCLNFPVPSDRKYHIVEFFMTPATKYVHHSVVYACSGTPKRHTDGKAFDCLAEARDAQCQAFYAVWAPGVNPFTPPKLAGYPFGKADYQWFTLEVHYTNPELDTGMTDNSTFHVKYTPNLRQYDMGVLTLGTTALTIPPGQRNVTISNFCPGGCTAAKLNQSVTLVHSFYHMHGLGAAMVTQHFDGDKELRPLGKRTAYNYDYQDPVAIPVDTAILKPGDSLITTCTFDSRSRTNVTYWGPRTEDEMCFNFLAYYPRMPVDFCQGVGVDPAVLCSTGPELGQLQDAPTQEAVNALFQQFISEGKVVVSPAPTEYAPFNETCSGTFEAGSPPPAAVQSPPPTDASVFSATPNECCSHTRQGRCCTAGTKHCSWASAVVLNILETDLS